MLSSRPWLPFHLNMPEFPVFQEKLEVQITCESFHFLEHRQLFTFIFKHADFEFTTSTQQRKGCSLRLPSNPLARGEFPETQTNFILKDQPIPTPPGPTVHAQQSLLSSQIHARISTAAAQTLSPSKEMSEPTLSASGECQPKSPFSVGDTDQYRGHRNKRDSLPCGPAALPAAHLPGSRSPSYAPTHLGHLCSEQHTCPSDDRGERCGRTRSS